jgi:hypothetical protein
VLYTKLALELHPPNFAGVIAGSYKVRALYYAIKSWVQSLIASAQPKLVGEESTHSRNFWTTHQH